MDLVAAMHRRAPDAALLVAGDRRMTLDEYVTESRRWAAAFAAQGVASGDRVVLVMSNSCEFFAALLGVNMVGGIAVPLSTIIADKVRCEITHSRGRAKS